MKQSGWLRVAVQVGAEAAETVCELFARYAKGGVVLEQDRAGSEAELVRVSAYLAEDESLDEKQAKLERGLASLRLIQAIPDAEYERVAEQNWMEAWKERFQPLEVGRRFLVQPAWLEAPRTERLVLRIDPGMAFGTGVHPTTQLSLELMESVVKRGDSVLDMGSGSGILSFAAEKLGAGQVLGVEIDGDAIANAEHNAKLNESGVRFVLGSLQQARASAPEGGFELVVANIIAPKLLGLIGAGLCELVAADGRLLLSGMLKGQVGEIEKALAEQGFVVGKRRERGDWAALVVNSEQ